jgi:3-isopropylmalate dehydratase small subunit
MEDADATFAEKVQPGDVIVAGSNFGCGSSREHAPISIKAAGVSCVIAKTFARIFFRNCINTGLPILACPEAAEAIEAGDEIEVDLGQGVIRNLAKGCDYATSPFPEEMQRIIAAGGLMPFVKQSMCGSEAASCCEE